jgi:MHS family shikimate/dehydroshikimate transporter-like MFS transporter
VASLVGAIVDWYDFFLYGTVGSLVFGKLFFPETDPTVGTLATFATFGVGFLFRPLGGIVFGHFGDRIGRKTMLIATLFLMGLASTLIGVLPTYGSVGMLAPVLLVILRAVQGFAVGGEWAGAALLATEHAPGAKKGLYSSWVQVGASGGLLLSTGLVTLMSGVTSEEQFLAWGWRIPFLVSLVIVAAGWVIRMKVAETPTFDKVKEEHVVAKAPLLGAIKENPKAFLLIIGMRLSELVGFYTVTVFALSYATKDLGIGKSTMLTANMIGAVVSIAAIPLFAALSDRIGRRPVFIGGAVAGVVLAFPFFWGVETTTPALIWLMAVLVINLSHDPLVSVQQPLFTELFGPRFRYSGAGVGYQLASALGGGFTPLIAASLVVAAGGHWTYVALYMMGASVISVIAGLAAPKAQISGGVATAEASRS